MKKRSIDPADSRSASRGKRLVIGVSVLCLLTTVSLVISLALLGNSLGRFSQADANVIPLIPTEKDRMEAAPEPETEETGPAPTEQTQPQSPREEAPEETDPAPTEQTQPKKTQKAASKKKSSSGGTKSSGGTHGSMEVTDNNKQVWKSDTQVDLFQTSYDGTVVSDNNEKVIAPGTTYSYPFTIKNNGDVPLNYTISLRVDTYLGDDATYSAIPLQWRLLSDNGAVVTDWKGYNERTETMKRDSLKVRNQDGYTVQWRWPFERKNMDAADTQMGNIAVNKSLGAKATITVYAEQSDDGKKPSGHWWQPKTGDTFPLYTYLAVAAVSACGLLILLVTARRRKKNGDEKHRRGKP